jgi:hypothetical protein
MVGHLVDYILDHLINMISVGNSGNNQSVAPKKRRRTIRWRRSGRWSLDVLLRLQNNRYAVPKDLETVSQYFPLLKCRILRSESARAFNGSCVPPSIHPFTTPSGCHDELQNHGVQLQIGLTGRFVAACYASTTDKKQKGQHRNPSAECSIITVFFDIVETGVFQAQ